MKILLQLFVVCLLVISLQGVNVTWQEDSLSEYLWQKTTALHEEALKSSYIQALKSGSLDPVKFGAYNVQDSVYCYYSKQSMDTAAERATNQSLKAFFEARAKSYDTYYKSLFKEWQIQNPSGIQLGSACAGYVNHIHNVATSMDPIYLVPALIPCARLWPWIGGQMGAKTENFGVYTKWVRENLDPDSHGYEKYEAVINEAYKDGHIDKQIALKIYTLSMQGEVAFFSSV